MVSLSASHRSKPDDVIKSHHGVTKAHHDVTRTRSDAPIPRTLTKPHHGDTKKRPVSENYLSSEHKHTDKRTNKLTVSSNRSHRHSAGSILSIPSVNSSGSVSGKEKEKHSLTREHRSGSMKTSHELKKKKKKPVISGPLYIEPIDGREFKNSPPSAKKQYPLPTAAKKQHLMKQESFSAFLEQEVYLNSVLLAEQSRGARLAGVRNVSVSLCGARRSARVRSNTQRMWAAQGAAHVSLSVRK